MFCSVTVGLEFGVFFFNDTATTEIYTYGHTLSLHDALPISLRDVAERDSLFLAGATEGQAAAALQDVIKAAVAAADARADSIQALETSAEDRKSTRLNSSH